MVAALVVAVALVAPLQGDTDGGRLALALEREAAGLLVSSETDAPLVAVGGAYGAERRLTAAAVLRRFRFAPDTPVRVRSVRDFFAPQMARREWHGPEEALRARRFRRLVGLLLRTLRDVRVFEVGTREKHVFVLGVAPSGECVGLRTFVVET